MASFKSGAFGMLMLIMITIAAAATAADNYTTSEQHLKVNFVVDLNVQTLDSTAYIAFHADLRRRLAGRNIGPATNNVAVLPADNNINPQFFDLTLTGIGGARTTVRFRVGNLYVIGYQNAATPPIWFELGIRGDTQFISTSQFLGFRGDYTALSTAAKKEMTAINLNVYGFQAAVKALATSTLGNEKAAALILVAQTVSEACRFVVLSNGLSANLLSSQPVYLKDWMLSDLERNWGTYSQILLCYDQFPTTYSFPKPTINGQVIQTADDLRKKLGILLNSPVDKTKCKVTVNDVELPNVIEFLAQVQDRVEAVGIDA